MQMQHLDHNKCPEYHGALISEVKISEVPLYTFCYIHLLYHVVRDLVSMAFEEYQSDI